MSEWLFFLLLVWGGVYLITESLVTMPLRVLVASKNSLLESLLYCPWCVAFWVGVIATGYVFSTPEPLRLLAGGVAATGSIVLPKGLGLPMSAYAYEAPIVEARKSGGQTEQ